jgi:hypothetical protein
MRVMLRIILRRTTGPIANGALIYTLATLDHEQFLMPLPGGSAALANPGFDP